jgi:ADP-heptose:LPS heptosyltransferase/glycosyltransferase involved in cell wall biosynthesis
MKKLIFRGPVLTASGYGVHARQLLKALIESQQFDISVESVRWGTTSFISERSEFFDEIYRLSKKFEVEKKLNVTYDISVQVTIPIEFQKMADFNIGVTAGIETNYISPEWLLKVNEIIDLLIVPSVHSRNVFEQSKFKGDDGSFLELKKPIVIVPEAVDTDLFNLNTEEEKSLSLFDFDTNFNFLFVGLGFEKPFGEDRKNISSLVKWFCERFNSDDNIGLVLKTGLACNSLMDFEATKGKINNIKEMLKPWSLLKLPKIHLVHGRLSDYELSLLYKHPKIKSFISLTHGEGYGLPLIEAAACGLPVLATNWSGHLDFLCINGKKKFVPLDFKLQQIPESAVWKGVMESNSSWANVDENDVKMKMKKISMSYDKPKEWALELAEHIKNNYSFEKIGKEFVDVVLSSFESRTEIRPKTAEEGIKFLKEQFSVSGRKTLLFTMPMSAGDVFLSTGVIDSLRKVFPDHFFFFATDVRYADILAENSQIDAIVDWQSWMTNVPLCEQVFDEVFTPNLAIQTNASNWVKGGKGRKLGEEIAWQCNVELGSCRILKEKVDSLPDSYIAFHPGSGVGQWEARNYLYWQDVIDNVKNLTGIEVVQTGLADDNLFEGCVDLRGKTTYNQLAYVISGARAVVGIDSLPMHLAAHFEIPVVSLFGSSFSNSTGPVFKDCPSKNKSCLLETTNRYSCKKACYKYSCSENKEHPCINEISPQLVVRSILGALGDIDFETAENLMSKYSESSLKISGYTHVFNAKNAEIPFVESIKSMLGFCDEVIVVDGGSDDGTVEDIKQIGDERIKVIERKWDWEEPAMDGMQKAFGRAMCSGDFLWQQDADEIVHEDDFSKIKKFVKKIPKNVKLISLPIIELWGDNETVRTDRHSWKWRLSRNSPEITHGINVSAKIFDEKTGKVFAKKNRSDGCEYVHAITGEFIPHVCFYSQELDSVRINNPVKYGEIMNKIFSETPSVFHYSWECLPRKIRSFKSFWNRCWSNLYNDEKQEDRFPDIKTEEDILAKAQELKDRGGEHDFAETFKLIRKAPI